MTTMSLFQKKPIQTCRCVIPNGGKFTRETHERGNFHMRNVPNFGKRNRVNTKFTARRIFSRILCAWRTRELEHDAAIPQKEDDNHNTTPLWEYRKSLQGIGKKEKTTHF